MNWVYFLFIFWKFLIEFGIFFQDWVGISLYWLVCFQLSTLSSRMSSYFLLRLNLTQTSLMDSRHMAWILGTPQPCSLCFFLGVWSLQHIFSSLRIQDQRYPNLLQFIMLNYTSWFYQVTSMTCTCSTIFSFISLSLHRGHWKMLQWYQYLVHSVVDIWVSNRRFMATFLG